MVSKNKYSLANPKRRYQPWCVSRPPLVRGHTGGYESNGGWLLIPPLKQRVNQPDTPSVASERLRERLPGILADPTPKIFENLKNLAFFKGSKLD
jgi:hypothetical protein